MRTCLTRPRAYLAAGQATSGKLVQVIQNMVGTRELVVVDTLLSESVQ